MDKTTTYRTILRDLPDWVPYLRENSNLPGPRGNLELIYAAAEEASSEQIHNLISYDPLRAPENTPECFLAVCGTVGLGRLLAECTDPAAQQQILSQLRELANDPRWRVREGVAMAFQRLGDSSVDRLLEALQSFTAGTLLEQRAAAAAICEPRLLRDQRHAWGTMDLIERITNQLAGVQQRKSEDFQVLRQALAYCWSVAIAAFPKEGKARFTSLVDSTDRDIRWIARENLKKNRLIKMDAAWVEEMKVRLG